MTEKFIPQKKKEQIYRADAPLTTLREVPIDAIPPQLTSVFDWISTTQNPNFGDFGNDSYTKDVVLESAGAEQIYIAVRISQDDNTIDGLAVDRDGRTAHFFSDTFSEVPHIEVLFIFDNRESAAVLGDRLAAISEFARSRCDLPLYSPKNPAGDALRVWEELQTAGIAKKVTLQNGAIHYHVL